jgi:hypothetical protein
VPAWLVSATTGPGTNLVELACDGLDSLIHLPTTTGHAGADHRRDDRRRAAVRGHLINSPIRACPVVPARRRFARSHGWTKVTLEP